MFAGVSGSVQAVTIAKVFAAPVPMFIEVPATYVSAHPQYEEALWSASVAINP